MKDIYLSLPDQGLTELSDIPDNVTHLFCDNNLLKELPELPKNLKVLFCENNLLESLPELPETLQYLYCSNNRLKKLPKLPKGLLHLSCNNNQITRLPKIPKNLPELELVNNYLTNVPKISSKSLMRIENNPVSKDLYRIYSPNPKNIIFEDGVHFLILRKGTILFRSMQFFENYKEMYLGLSLNDKEILFPDHQTYFMLHPFNDNYGYIKTINVLQEDTKIFLGISPSKRNKSDMTKDFYIDCSKNRYKSEIISIYLCIKDSLRQKYKDVYGWITLDFHDRPMIWSGENRDFLKYYEYISYYENYMGVFDRVEVKLYPRKIKHNEDVKVKTQNYVDYISKHSDEFIYKTICLYEHKKFKDTKLIMDSLLSSEGYTNSLGTFKIKRDFKDGFYYLIE